MTSLDFFTNAQGLTAWLYDNPETRANLRRLSTDALLDRLGEHIARLPVTALPKDRPGFGCSFRDIPPAPYVDMSAVERLEIIAADAREEMGEERWQQLQDEWSNREDNTDV